MIKNIIKRVIVGVLIALILSFLGSCNVNATTVKTDDWMLNMNRPIGAQFWNWTTATNRVEVADVRTMGFTPTPEDNYWGDTPYAPGLSIGQYGISVGVNTDTNYYHGYLYHFSMYIGTTATLSIYDSSNSMHVGTIFSDMDYQAARLVDIDCSTFYLSSSFTHCYILESIISPSQSGSWVFGRVKSSSSGTHTVGLFGYTSSNLGILNAVTNATLSSIIDSKGFATQSSVNQVNTNIQNQTTQQHQDAQQTQQKLDDINNTMKDDNVDDPSDYSSNVASNGVITQLITLPITLFQKLLNSTSASCTPFQLGDLLGTTLTIPCINLQNYLGSTLFNVIDILISGLFIYSISRKMVKVFNSLSSMKEGDVVNG